MSKENHRISGEIVTGLTGFSILHLQRRCEPSWTKTKVCQNVV